MEYVVCREKEPAIAAVFALPIIQSAMSDLPRAAVVVIPNLFASRGIESCYAVVPRYNVHHPVHDDRIGTKATGRATGRIEPNLLQLAHVRFINLLQGRILSRIRSAVVIAPPCIFIALRG